MNKNVADFWRFHAIFENAMTSEDIMAAFLNILGGQGILKS
jgi:hypothetical protein